MKRHGPAILTLIVVATAWGATFALIKDVPRIGAALIVAAILTSQV